MTTRLRRTHLILATGMTLLLGACSGASAPTATTRPTGAATAPAQAPTAEQARAAVALAEKTLAAAEAQPAALRARAAAYRARYQQRAPRRPINR